MKKVLLFLLLPLLGYSQNNSKNYIQWNEKKESFDQVAFWGGDEHSTFPNELRLINKKNNSKKFSFIRISGFTDLNENERISFCNTSGILTRRPTNPNEKCLIHVGIIDQENDYHYYQAKTATLKGLGNNMYELNANFHDVDAAGNDYTNNPNYPSYEFKAVFEYIPK